MVKIRFELEVDEDGYPPATAESVWAEATDTADEYIVANIPFYARIATRGDRVRTKLVDGVRVVEDVVASAPSSLLRVVVYDEDKLEGVRLRLLELGCWLERMNQMFAIDVPLTTDLAPVQAYLASMEGRDALGYEEPILRHPE